MGYLHFLARTLITWIVRSVGNWLFVIFSAVIAAVFYYLYPTVEAAAVGIAFTAVTQLTLNAIHMAYEARRLWVEMEEMNDTNTRAYRHRTVVACDDAIMAVDRMYGRWCRVEDNFLLSDEKNLVKREKESIQNARYNLIELRNEIRAKY